jgi:dinuclear metal center YbgI/SA1388 family protein
MPRVRDVLSVLNSIAPPHYILEGDKVGLQIGDLDAEVKRAVVSLDHSAGAVKECMISHAQLLLCHHPLLMNPLSNVNYGASTPDRVAELIVGGVAYIAAHTNWDCAPGGVNDALADELGLVDVSPFGTASGFPGLKLIVFCPEDAVEKIMDAASAAGAGMIGDYLRCGFFISGQGTFDAPDTAKPAVGKAGARNSVPEVRLEMEVAVNSRIGVETAVRAAHPYEEPAIEFVNISKQGYPISRKGRLRQPLSPAKFREYVDKALGFRSTLWESKAQMIQWVGVCGGSASDEWPFALSNGCDVLVTGEVKQHHALEATETGIAMCASGHYATEQPGVKALAAAMQSRMPEVEWKVYTPQPGANGRPL